MKNNQLQSPATTILNEHDDKICPNCEIPTYSEEDYQTNQHYQMCEKCGEGYETINQHIHNVINDTEGEYGLLLQQDGVMRIYEGYLDFIHKGLNNYDILYNMSDYDYPASLPEKFWKNNEVYSFDSEDGRMDLSAYVLYLELENNNIHFFNGDIFIKITNENSDVIKNYNKYKNNINNKNGISNALKNAFLNNIGSGKWKMEDIYVVEEDDFNSCYKFRRPKKNNWLNEEDRDEIIEILKEKFDNDIWGKFTDDYQSSKEYKNWVMDDYEINGLKGKVFYDNDNLIFQVRNEEKSNDYVFIYNNYEDSKFFGFDGDELRKVEEDYDEYREYVFSDNFSINYYFLDIKMNEFTGLIEKCDTDYFVDQLEIIKIYHNILTHEDSILKTIE